MYFQHCSQPAWLRPQSAYTPNAVSVTNCHVVCHSHTELHWPQQQHNNTLEMACWASRTRRCRQSSAEAGTSAVACSHAVSVALTRPKRSAQRGHSSSSSSEALPADAAVWHTCIALALSLDVRCRYLMTAKVLEGSKVKPKNTAFICAIMRCSAKACQGCKTGTISRWIELRPVVHDGHASVRYRI